MTFSIRDLTVGEPDSTGAVVIDIYSKVVGSYAVYRTEKRVLVHFSDDPALGADQRKLLAPLGPSRGEINGLIDGWRKGEGGERERGFAGLRRALEHDQRAKAALFDRRVADALVLALQGAAAEAAGLLASIKADIIEERNSVARTEYLVVASGLFAVLIALLMVITRYASDLLPEGDASTMISLNAAGFASALGALGALFSIALALRSRELLTDLQSLDNVADAAMRIVIGAISAFVLYCLVAAGYFSFSFGEAAIGDGTLLQAWQPTLAVIGFVAGFSERLVGNALNRVNLGASTLTSAKPGGVVAPLPGVQGSQPDERNPLGRPTAAAEPPVQPASSAINDDDETTEGGHDHSGVSDQDLTSDVELPEATGGVERAS